MNTYAEVASTDTCTSEDYVADNLVLVKRIAYHMLAKLPDSVDVNDLIQSGMIGLLEAASNFDATRGASFETYAGIRIRGAMLDDIRKNDWTPRSVHHKYRLVADAINEIESETGRPPTGEEIAARLDISINDYHDILADSASSRLFSYEETLDEPTLARNAPPSKAPGPDDALYREQFKTQLAESISLLPEKERLVLALYYERELNLKEIGAVLDVSESRVCQIHGQAVTRIRAAAKRW